MRISSCTLTGADESTDPKDIYALSKVFPMAEWGFLYSPERQGSPGRFPSVKTMTKAFGDLSRDVRVALHICGDGVQDALDGESVAISLLDLIADRKGRVQLNFNHNKRPVNPAKFNDLLMRYPNTQFITQMNEDNRLFGYWHSTSRIRNQAILFDESNGQGLLAEKWQSPLPGVPCGYAGGLGVDNITEQLGLISKVAGDNEIWVDMEGSLRFTDELGADWLDIDRCRNVLFAASQWTKINNEVR